MLYVCPYLPSSDETCRWDRREIGFRTVFNLLGPLTNPAGADRQIIGVYDASLAEKLAYTLRELGLVRCLVVAGEDGLDEISVSAPTKIVELKDGEIRSYRVFPEDLNVASYSLHEISGGRLRTMQRSFETCFQE